MLDDDKIFSARQEEQIKKAFSALVRKTQTENLSPDKALEEIRRKLPRQNQASTNEHYDSKLNLKIRALLNWIFVKPNMSYAFSTMLIAISVGITHQIANESDNEIIIRSLPPVEREGVALEATQDEPEKPTSFSRPTLIVGNNLPLSRDIPGWLEVADVAIAAGYMVSISKADDSSTKTISLNIKKSQIEKDITLRLLLGVDESFEGEILVTFD